MKQKSEFDRCIFDELATVALSNLGGKWRGSDISCRCPSPLHPDRTPSFSIRRTLDGGVLLHCFGCTASYWDYIRWLRSHFGNFGDIGIASEKLSSNRPLPSAAQSSSASARNAKPAATPEAKFERIIWRLEEALPISHPRAQNHFYSRGLLNVDSSALRFHPNHFHPSGDSYPAILAIHSNLNGDFQGYQAYFLDPDGIGKASVAPQKMTHGSMSDGSVQLAPAGRKLLVGEGMVTCLTVMQETGLPAWASLGAKRMVKMALPECVNEVIILADNDNPGRDAAAAAEARWQRMGLKVGIAIPPDPFNDFNDMLMTETKNG